MRFTLRIPFIARDYTPPSIQDRCFTATNDYRRSVGLSPLLRDSTLDAIAQRRSELVLQDWEETHLLRHDNPAIEGDRYFELAPSYGLPNWRWLGENLALNNFADPVEEAMRGWKNSPAHDANLKGDYEKLGIGYTFRSPSGISVLVQVFLDA